MSHARSHARKKTPKRVLALPDLEHAKSAVLSSLTSRSGQRTYDHAIREFVAWYCSEPRLAFNRTVVLRCSERSTGSSPTSSAKGATSGRCRSRSGSSPPSMRGRRPPPSPRAPSFGDQQGRPHLGRRDVAGPRARRRADGLRDLPLVMDHQLLRLPPLPDGESEAAD